MSLFLPSQLAAGRKIAAHLVARVGSVGFRLRAGGGLLVPHLTAGSQAIIRVEDDEAAGGPALALRLGFTMPTRPLKS